MRESQYLAGRFNLEGKKRIFNSKVFENEKPLRDEFILNAKKAMGKKYMQDHNIFKQRQEEPKKQHRQVVISEEFIKSSKLYKLLREKMQRSDALYMKEQKLKIKEEIMQLKTQNYQEKIKNWELKNRLMELKILYREEEQQRKRLAEYPQYEEEAEQEPAQEEENQMASSLSQQDLQNQNELKYPTNTYLQKTHQQSENNFCGFKDHFYSQQYNYQDTATENLNPERKAIDEQSQVDRIKTENRLRFSELLKQLYQKSCQRTGQNFNNQKLNQGQNNQGSKEVKQSNWQQHQKQKQSKKNTMSGLYENREQEGDERNESKEGYCCEQKVEQQQQVEKQNIEYQRQVEKAQQFGSNSQYLMSDSLRSNF